MSLIVYPAIVAKTTCFGGGCRIARTTPPWYTCLLTLVYDHIWFIWYGICRFQPTWIAFPFFSHIREPRMHISNARHVQYLPTLHPQKLRSRGIITTSWTSRYVMGSCWMLLVFGESSPSQGRVIWLSVKSLVPLNIKTAGKWMSTPQTIYSFDVTWCYVFV